MQRYGVPRVLNSPGIGHLKPVEVNYVIFDYFNIFVLYLSKTPMDSVKPFPAIKNLLLLILVNLLLIPAVYSQSGNDTVFYDQDLMKTSDKSYMYLAVRMKNDTGYLEQVYRENGALYKEGNYLLKDGFPLESGLFVTYDSTGTIESENNYLNGKRNGDQREYYPSGSLYYSEQYADNFEHGKRMVYYEDGKLKREEVFEKGELVNGNCYTPDGRDTVYYKFWTYPRFPGGDEARIRFLIKKTRYPEKAIRKNLQGIVYLSFTVTKTGVIDRPRILRGVHPLLDNEAIRVINAMPVWEPGTLDGKPVNVRFNMPMKFTIG
jgi:protein TonB